MSSRRPDLLRPLGVVLLLSCAVLPAAEVAMDGVAPAWRSAGWGGGAYYFAAAWHPTDPDVLYLGGDCAGVYRSDDRAQSWEFANRGIVNYAVYCLAVSPADPDLVYALTDGGLCKSTDRARSWSFVAASAADACDIRSRRHDSVRAVAIDPRDAAVVYAGSRTGSLWKSADGGTNWSELPYRSALPAPRVPPAYLGAGSLRLDYDGTVASPDPQGRASRILDPQGPGEDWSGYARLTARVLAPTGAPGLQAQLVVQTGADWSWQAGAWTDCPGERWVEVPLDLRAVADPGAVRMLHLVLRTFQPGWKGEVAVDAVALHVAADGSLAPGEVPDGSVTRLLADWEAKGDTAGWAANQQAADSRKVTAVRQAAAQRGGDVVSSVAVAGDGTVYVSNTRHGVFRSDDAGASWSALETPQRVMSVTVDPRDPAVVWAACDRAGIRRSSDRGATWTAFDPAPDRKLAVREIALHPLAPERVYAIGTAGWGGWLLRSDDGGQSWSGHHRVRPGRPGNPTLPEEGGGGDPPGLCDLSAVTNLTLNPADPDQLFIAGNWRNVFSADGGRSLEERSTGADNTCVTDIQFLAGMTYVTAMDEGLLVSADEGGTWRQLVPLKYDPQISGHFWRVRVAASGDSTRIVATASPWTSFGDPSVANRVFVSTDDGASFTCSTSGLPDYVPDVNCMWGRSHPRALAQHPTDSEILYLGMDGDPEPAKNRPGGGVFRSADGGLSWTRCAGQPGGRRMYYGLAVDPSDPRRLYWSSCGEGGGTWRSDDEGASWVRIFDRETWSFNLAVAPSGRLLVGAAELHGSTDHGATWTALTAFGDGATIVGIAIDPVDEDRIWISRTTWDAAATGGIWRSIDGGASWQEITGDIPFRKPQILRYNPQTHTLWAGGVGLFTLAQ